MKPSAVYKKALYSAIVPSAPTRALSVTSFGIDKGENKVTREDVHRSPEIHLMAVKTSII